MSFFRKNYSIGKDKSLYNWQRIDDILRAKNSKVLNKGVEEFRKILEKAVTFGAEVASSRKKEKPGLPGASAVAQEIAERYRDKLAWESEYQIMRHYGAKSDGMRSEATPEPVKGLIHAYLRALPKCLDFSAG